MTAWLRTQGYTVNRKRAQRLMQRMGLAAIYQRLRLSGPISWKEALTLKPSRCESRHADWPYLLI